jgi:hypothetical protein
MGGNDANNPQIKEDRRTAIPACLSPLAACFLCGFFSLPMPEETGR